MSRRLPLSLSCIRTRIRSGALSALVLVAAVLLTASASLDPTTADPPVGQSRTLMPNGTWLLIGGRISTEPVASAAILNPETNQITLGRVNTIETEGFDDKGEVEEGEEDHI